MDTTRLYFSNSKRYNGFAVIKITSPTDFTFTSPCMVYLYNLDNPILIYNIDIDYKCNSNNSNILNIELIGKYTLNTNTTYNLVPLVHFPLEPTDNANNWNIISYDKLSNPLDEVDLGGFLVVNTVNLFTVNNTANQTKGTFLALGVVFNFILPDQIMNGDVIVINVPTNN